MAVAIVDYQEVTSWQSSGTPKSTSAAITWQAGDLIVAVAGDEGANQPAVPTATGLTFASVVGNNAGSTCSSRISTATAAAGGSSVVTATAAAGFWGMGVWVLRGHNGAGVSAEQHTTTHTVSISPSAGSLVIWGVFDFSAAVNQAMSPTPDTVRESSVTGANYAAYAADVNSVPGGAQAFGLSAGGTAGALSIVVLEVKAGATDTPTIDLMSPAALNGPDAPPGFFESLLLPVPSADVITPIAGADTGSGSETSDVQATVPGSDSSTGSEAGTVAATVDGSDSGTGTDGQTSLVVPIAGTESGTGTEAGTASVTAPGSDTSTGTEAGTVSATAAGSESATGTDTGSASVTAPGSDSGTGTDGGVVTETGAGGEGGAGFDSGTVSVTAAGADSGTGTDSGVVVDVTGGATTISDSDSGTGTEVGTVLDVTPPAPPVVDTGPSGGTRVVDSDYGDETAIFPVEETRAVTGSDFGVGWEAGVVVDLTPRKPLRIRLPRRAAPAPAVEPEPVETFRALFDGDAGLATDAQAVGVELEAADAARGSETGDMQDVSEGDAEELQILALLGVL